MKIYAQIDQRVRVTKKNDLDAIALMGSKQWLLEMRKQLLNHPHPSEQVERQIDAIENTLSA